MDARIIITGNQSLGYKVALELPGEWLKKFGEYSKMCVSGRRLQEKWSFSSDAGATRFVLLSAPTEAEAREAGEGIKAEIKAAKEYLKSLVDLHHECIISLD